MQLEKLFVVNKITPRKLDTKFKDSEFYILPLSFTKKTELDQYLYAISKGQSTLNLRNKDYIFMMLSNSICDENGELVFNNDESKLILVNAMDTNNEELATFLDYAYTKALEFNKIINSTVAPEDTDVKN